jgi:single-stranded-DNA-specific exonuclease
MRWRFPQPVETPHNLRDFVGGHPLVSEILTRKGILTPDLAKPYLNPDLYKPTSPFALPGMQKAVELVSAAMDSGDRITIWGDFDVDGQTSTTLLFSALAQMGADIDFYIPVRKRESHGISLPSLQKTIDSGTRLLLTCDTGISEFAAVAYARSQGLAVVITDHHKLPENLPDANVIVNPNFLQQDHPLHPMPGVAVAYKFITGLIEYRQSKLDPTQFLDLVSLGIVADLALLTSENRYLLQKGLEVLQTSGRLGIRKLLDKAEIQQKNINEELIGFQIAPRLNALGRLDDANNVVELFLTQDEARAEIIATQIEGLNQHRKMLTRQVSQAALAQVERDIDLRHAPILVLFNQEWPAGIVGLVASHLVSRYQKPAILLSGSGETVSGSARSVHGLDITAAIQSQAGLLSGFGGHAMAGGLSLPKANLPAFRTGISQYVSENLDLAEKEPFLDVTAILNLDHLSLDLVDDLARLSPFGHGNPPLNFISPNLFIVSHKVVGRNQEHRQLTVQDDQGITQNVIWWNGADELLPTGKFDLAYHLNASDFHGVRELNLTWVDANIHQPIIVEDEHIKVIDHRVSKNPFSDLTSILAQDPAAILWAEVNPPVGMSSYERTNLPSAPELIIWNIPPSDQVIKEVLTRVQPDTVHLFAQVSAVRTLQGFLVELAGMLKFARQHHQGILDPSNLAIRTGCTLNLIQISLRWFQAKGTFIFTSVGQDQIAVSPGDNQVQVVDTTKHSQELEFAWMEFQAWQRYYCESNANTIINS